MKRKRWILFFSTVIALLLTVVPAGLGLWFFPESNRTADVSGPIRSPSSDDDHLVKVDDIAENYFFAADVDASDFYTVYFFPSPLLAEKTGTVTEGGPQSKSITVKYNGGSKSNYTCTDTSSGETYISTSRNGPYSRTENDIEYTFSFSEKPSQNTNYSVTVSWTEPKVTTENPAQYYDAHGSKYANTDCGYWGGRTSDDSGFIEPDVPGDDGTIYGYKKFENVYR